MHVRAVASLLLVSLTACRGSGQTEIAPVQVTQEDTAALVTSVNAFGLDLYAQVREGEGNRFLSPLSVWTALAMTWAGARGETADEMARTLHITLPPERTHAAVQSTLAHLVAGDTNHEFTIANALWSSQGRPASEEYSAILRTHYGAEAREVDFAGDVDGSRTQINDWVADRTNDKIQDLFPAGVLDAATRFVLTNAVYFLGEWEEKFDPERTREEPFRLAGGGESPTKLMHQKEHFGYAEVDGTKLLQMTYERSPLAMVVILPAEPDGLPAVEQDLDAETLAGWIAQLQHSEVRVALPRFEFTQGQGLADPLRAMGMPAAFDAGRADFSGIDGTQDLFLQAVIHKAFVKVDEDGTEAAAATGVAVGLAAMAPDEPKVFRADRPFLFLIRDVRTGAVLFMGRLVEPAE